jgi:hypothetical protein
MWSAVVRKNSVPPPIVLLTSPYSIRVQGPTVIPRRGVAGQTSLQSVSPVIPLARTGVALWSDVLRLIEGTLRSRTALAAENLPAEAVGALPQAAGAGTAGYRGDA